MPGVGTTTEQPRLIINADDFGMSEGINRGILAAFRAGALRSTSIMVGMPAFEDAVRVAQAAGDGLGVGLHFTLTIGRPLTDAPTLVDESGEFLKPDALLARAVFGNIAEAEVAAECIAQIARARDAGIRLTHLDGHHHAHLGPGAIARAVRRVVEAERIPAVRRPLEPLFSEYGTANWWHRLPERLLVGVLTQMSDPRNWGVRTTDLFLGHGLLGQSRFGDLLVRALDTLPIGTTELMVHPGYVDGPLPGNDPYTTQREVELEALLSPDVVERLRAGRICLTHFGEL